MTTASKRVFPDEHKFVKDLPKIGVKSELLITKKWPKYPSKTENKRKNALTWRRLEAFNLLIYIDKRLGIP